MRTGFWGKVLGWGSDRWWGAGGRWEQMRVLLVGYWECVGALMRHWKGVWGEGEGRWRDAGRACLDGVGRKCWEVLLGGGGGTGRHWDWVVITGGALGAGEGHSRAGQEAWEAKLLRGTLKGLMSPGGTWQGSRLWNWEGSRNGN